MKTQDFEKTWQPSASIQLLRLRADILNRVRQFFAKRKILEVDTPLLSQATVTDKHLHSFQTDYFFANPKQQKTLYLQTSPEFAMKRLLAADSGPIYQICKAFRNLGESGCVHNPEFTMLEWYRPGFDHHHLMDEMEQLLTTLLDYPSAQRFTYEELFEHFLKINPHLVTIKQLRQTAKRIKLTINNSVSLEHDDWLQLLMTHYIEPNLAQHPVFIYDFPASQASLARIRAGTPPIAERFEVYVKGLELANGFHELSSASEQRQRFLNDLKQREKLGYRAVPIDERLLAALEHGIPDCAGVALGIDRLVMLIAEKNTINDVITFPIENA